LAPSNYGSLFAKEPNKRDDILQKRPIVLRSLLIVATPYAYAIYNTYRSILWMSHGTACLCVSYMIRINEAFDMDE